MDGSLEQVAEPLGVDILLFLSFHDQLFITNKVNGTFNAISLPAVVQPVLEAKIVLKVNAGGVCDVCTSST